MIRRCCYCGEIMGEKEPLENKAITDGICDACMEKEFGEFKEELKQNGKKYLIMGIWSSNDDISAMIADFAIIPLSSKEEWTALISIGKTLIDTSYFSGHPDTKIIEAIDFNADAHDINFYSSYSYYEDGTPYELDYVDQTLGEMEYYVVGEDYFANMGDELKKMEPAEVEGVRLTVHKDGSFNWSANLKKTAESVTLETHSIKYEDLMKLLRESEQDGNNKTEE